VSKLSIPDMSCGHCAATITKAVKALDANASITFDMEQRSAELATSAPMETVLAALAAEGYPATPAP
jgi:copper chaperone